MKKKRFLDDVYRLNSHEDMVSLYDDWSVTYDEEIKKNGYATPKRCAEALAGAIDNLFSPVLDFGCGTGMSGEALVEAGFKNIDGCDLSERMLEVARQKNIYRNLWCSDFENPVQFTEGEYQHITAIGVISVGAAPIGLMDDLIRALPKGGTLTFSFNEHTLQDPVFENRVFEYVDTAAAHLLFKEHGAHLPGIGMSSTVYILRKQ